MAADSYEINPARIDMLLVTEPELWFKKLSLVLSDMLLVSEPEVALGKYTLILAAEVGELKRASTEDITTPEVEFGPTKEEKPFLRDALAV